jgi:nitroreductase
MELLDKLNWRYAAKAMNGQKISQEKIDNIIEAISLAPTSSGLQPFIVLPKNRTFQMINKFELLNEQKEKKIQFRV